ncbi:MAG: ABC transporter permease [Spirochaetales bacterium]|nr:ABC transporter permease [Spirochaetales bacterium]
MALIKIAWRNIREHKVKTFIIGIIVTLGITILVTGNSMMETAARGIRKNYIENYTGHLIVTGESDMNLTLLGAMDINSFNEAMPVVPHYSEIKEFAASLPEVEAVSGQAAGRAQISYGEDNRSFTILFGIEPGEYAAMFPGNIDILDGEFLTPGVKGILLSKRVAKRMNNGDGAEIKAGDKVLLTGFSAGAGAKIRELNVTGIFRFKSSNVQLDMVSLIDIDSLRALNGMTLGAELEVETTKEETNLIETFDGTSPSASEDDMFGSDIVEAVDEESGKHTSENLDSILGDIAERELYSQVDSGAWHFLLIKLKSQDFISKVKAELISFFREKGLLADIADWKSGAGPMGQMADVIQIVFNAVVLIIAVVAVIIIMNTLVISVTERIPEIGTMRALGAQKGFVRKMIIIETTMISTAAGLIGIVLGSAILFILGKTGIEAPNIFFEIIFGGKILYPAVSLPSIAMSLAIIVGIGILASLYPVSIALRIQPVRAIQAA